jgi:hypothetical protein
MRWNYDILKAISIELKRSIKANLKVDLYEKENARSYENQYKETAKEIRRA